ncbi:MAG: DEAD/DEAH box helicase, partial [Planctomycetota bacterium]
MDRASVNSAPITYDDSLPIAARRAEIAQAIRAHQVVVVCGETGSGKSTQLPKICLELGRGTDRLIGHTQPRRIAARSIATRIAEELGCTVGTRVGYKIRFEDVTHPDTRVKVMTDGILLAETQQDRLLEQYDTLIIDEAHERSLNIDFLLGILVRLLARRADLKLIITSATIDAERFATHFPGEVPIIQVSGRTYPVEIRYRPLESSAGEIDLPRAIAAVLAEVNTLPPGDVLVFLPTERDIHETVQV